MCSNGIWGFSRSQLLCGCHLKFARSFVCILFRLLGLPRPPNKCHVGPLLLNATLSPASRPLTIIKTYQLSRILSKIKIVDLGQILIFWVGKNIVVVAFIPSNLLAFISGCINPMKVFTNIIKNCIYLLICSISTCAKIQFKNIIH